MIKEITSLKNEKIKYFASLKNNDSIKKEKLFLVEGEHLIKMAKDYLVATLSLKKIDYLSDDIDQYIVKEEILKKLSLNKSCSKVIGVCRLIQKELEEDKPYIYLDCVQDPGNVGTILRTALAFNFKNIILSSDSANLYNPKVIQSSQGAIFNLNVIQGDLNALIDFKNKGYKIYSTTLNDKSKFLDEFLKIPAKTLLIFGNEGNGIREEIFKISDYFIKIEIDNIDSLNVGVATGIVLNYFKNKIIE